MLEAEVEQALHRIRRAPPRAAEDHDRAGPGQLIDPLRQLSLRDCERPVQVRDGELLGFPDVDQQRRVVACELRLQLLRRDLGDAIGRRGARDAAERGVIDEPVLGRLWRAEHALRVLVQLQLPERHRARVVEEEPADERLADADNELDRLGRLEGPDDPGEHAEDAGLRARRDELGRRRLGVQAPVARTGACVKDAHLALEPVDRAVDVRLAEEDAGVVDEVAGREVVRPVDDKVVAVQHVERVGGVEPPVVRDDRRPRVERRQAPGRRLELRPADVVRGVEDLPLEVGELDRVEVDQPEGPDPRCREVQRGRRAEAAGAYEEDLGAPEGSLAGDADLGKQQVPAVATQLVRRERLDRLRRGGRGRQPMGLGRRTPRDRGHDGDDVPVLQHGGVALQCADILVVHVDGDEAAEAPVYAEQVPPKGGMALGQLVDRLADRVGEHRDVRLAPGEAAEGRRDPDGGAAHRRPPGVSARSTAAGTAEARPGAERSSSLEENCGRSASSSNAAVSHRPAWSTEVTR